MNIFCLLWLPLFYLLWRSFPENDSSVGFMAFILGSIAAIVQIFLDSPVDPAGFGFSRWLAGFFIVSLPVLTPLLIYLLLLNLRIIRGSFDFAGFTLPWLIPGAVINALRWISLNDPITLILVPVLWTAIAVGVPFFIDFLRTGKTPLIVLAFPGILMVPLAAASSYWAFFSQENLKGTIFLGAALIPMLVSMTLSFIRAGDGS